MVVACKPFPPMRLLKQVLHSTWSNKEESLYFIFSSYFHFRKENTIILIMADPMKNEYCLNFKVCGGDVQKY
jgi:hypothetical protein